MSFNGAEIHLLVNHFPVVGYPFATAALLWGLARKENSVFIFGSVAAFVTAGATLASFYSGEGAEHVLKALSDYPRGLVHTHERTGKIMLFGSFVVLIISVMVLPIVKDRIEFLAELKIQKCVRAFLVLLCLSLSIGLAITAHQGGLIRHTEIRDAITYAK